MSKKFMDAERNFEGGFGRPVFESMAWGLSRHKLGLAFFLFINVLARSCLLMTSLLIGQWVDMTFGFGGHALLEGVSSEVFGASLVGLALLGFILANIYQVGFARVGVATAMEYHHETIYRVSRARLGFFDQNPVGRIFARFSSDFQVLTRSLGPMLAETVTSLLTLILITVFTSFTNIWFLPVMVVALVMNGVIYLLNRPRLRQERRETAVLRAPSISHFSETVQGFLSIRVFGKHSFFIQRFNDLVDHYYIQKLRELLVAQSLEFQLRLASGGIFVLAGGLGIFLSGYGLATIGEIGVILTFVGTASGHVQRICHLLSTMEDGLTAAERLDDYLRQPLETHQVLPAKAVYPTSHLWQPGGPQKAQGVPPNLGGSVLELRDFSLRYGGGPYVLQGLNLKVAAGEVLGVIGRTGAGKTSLFQGIMQFYPTTGDVLLDGAKPSHFSHPEEGTLALAEWRDRIGLISQQPTIFKGSIAYNLAGGGDVTEARMMEVLSSVGLIGWLHKQPHGLATQMEEGGRNLSAGQRQLLATARCLLRPTQLVLMDEATSAVDPESEERFNYATNFLLQGRTRIIIAHRLSTLENCHRVLWLKDGGIYKLDEPEKVLPLFRDFAQAEAVSPKS